MATKQFTYRGKTLEELKSLSLQDLAALLPARQRRSILRGWTDSQERFLKRLEKKGNNVKTHCRDMIVLPEMVGKTILIHNGKEFVSVMIQEGMIGHLFGELSLTRKKLQHSAPGVGASKSSRSVSVR